LTVSFTAEVLEMVSQFPRSVLAQTEAGRADSLTEWTRDGSLRHSKFVALHEDKDPKKVVRSSGTEAIFTPAALESTRCLLDSGKQDAMSWAVPLSL
jgi:hypothetical protein